jgi:hypothetical protein
MADELRYEQGNGSAVIQYEQGNGRRRSLVKFGELRLKVAYVIYDAATEPPGVGTTMLIVVCVAACLAEALLLHWSVTLSRKPTPNGILEQVLI